MRILFISSNRIGDAVLSTGLLSHLQGRHPDARFTIACGPVSAPLFGGLPGLEKIIIMRKRRYSRHWFDLWRQTVMTRWDLVVDLRRSAISYLLPAGRRAIQPKDHGPLHRVELLASTLGLKETPPAPVLWFNRPHLELAEKLMPADKPVLAVGPTANWAGKIWPAEKFADLITRLTGDDGPLSGAHVAVFGAPNERLQANPVLRAIPKDRRIDLVGKIDLLTAAACMEKAALYVGNDSGLMHMAAAVGVPTLGLFGPSRTEHYAPWGPHCAFVRTPEAYEELVGGPGYDHRNAETMMTSLSVETVADAAIALMNAPEGKAGLA
ncbi:glycosyltransferase family 9 protein [Aestuariispira insulae]|uniref:ADP-heptose:LPS heptosyltransferase n=1 Tax=Aestuariispira insulae TaxID=1461337 RepID=A0A3D9HS58_9PROT|nr:glycosyltransferase family 9 protein [Aestuariispira insulae]RED52255.1 ADP-heptose:LPS heptosyltransferase [Aestuariispira insulae]